MEEGELLGLEGWKDGGMLHICSDRTFHYRYREVASTKIPKHPKGCQSY